MSDRFDEVLEALERETCDMAGRLEKAQARVRELERTNQMLRSQLADIRRTFDGHTALEGHAAPDETAASKETPADDGDIGLAYLPESEPGAEGKIPPAGPVQGPENASAHERPDPGASISDNDGRQSADSEGLEGSVATQAGAGGEEKGVDTPVAASGDGVAPPVSKAPDTLSPQALLTQWYKRYPHTFFKHHTRPLAIGIHEALAAREAAEEKLVRRALAGYVNLPRYLKSVREGAARIDLDGQEVGRVGDDDARHAREQLKQLQAKQKAREAQKQQRRMAQKMSQLASRHQ